VPARLRNVDLYALWPLAVMVVIIVVTSLRSSHYFTAFNFENILSQAAPLGIVTMGQAVLLISAGLDLSVGYNMAFASICTGLLLERGQPLWLCIAAGVGGATLVGFVNGVIVAQNRAHPFIITLGTSIFLFGLDTQMTGGAPVDDMKGLYTAFGGNLPQGFPFFGLPSLTIPLVVVAGLALAGQINQASFNLAQNFELQSIACAVIGGTALFGGRGGALRSLQGVALWGVVQNAIVFAGLSSNYQQMALGAIIVVAVMVTRAQR